MNNIETFERLKEVREYRAKWTTDTPAGRTCRFTTDMNPALRLRKLPGTPLALERIRDQLIEKYGMMALTELRASLGKDSLSPLSLHNSFNQLGASVSKADMKPVLVMNFMKPFF